MGTDADDIIDIYEQHACVWVEARLQEGRFYERGWLDHFCELVSPRRLGASTWAAEPVNRQQHILSSAASR